MTNLPDFKNFKQIEAYLNAAIKNAQKNECSEIIADKLIENAEELVYQAYTPISYERRYSLTDRSNINSSMVDNNTLLVEMVANPSESVFGEEYTAQDTSVFSRWVSDGEVSPKPFGHGAWTEPRDFYGATIDQLKSSNEIAKAMSEGLKRQGIKTE